MSGYEDIKALLAKNNTTMKSIAVELSKIKGKNITGDNISQKLRYGSFRYDDAILIGDILGYDLQFVKRPLS